MTLQVNHALQLLGIKFISNSGEDLPEIPSKIINTSAISQSICNIDKNIHQINDLHYQVRPWRIFCMRLSNIYDDVIKIYFFTYMRSCRLSGAQGNIRRTEKKSISGYRDDERS